MPLLCYGLATNPFGQDKLKPLPIPTHTNVLARVDGFSLLPAVEATIDAAIGAKCAAFCLITGVKGGGRTSGANYVLSQYMTKRQLTQDRYVIVDVEVKDHKWAKVLRTCQTRLASRIDAQGWAGFPDGLKTRMQQILQGNQGNDIDQLHDQFETFAKLAANEMARLRPPAGFAVYIENVLNHELLEELMSILRDVQTVCAFTVLDDPRQSDLIAWYEAQVSSSQQILPLSFVTGQEVPALAQRRWAAHSETRIPFSVEGLVRGFSDRPRPIATVLRLLAQMLDIKAAEPRGSASVWPDDPDLELREDQIVYLVKILERSFRK